jgi:hypothetical protein
MVITQEPSLTAVTVPLAETVMMVGSVDCQVT